MVNSSLGEDLAVGTILCAMEGLSRQRVAAS